MRDFLEVAGIVVLGILALVATVFVVFGVPVLLYGATAVKGIERDAPAWLHQQGFSVVGTEGFTYGVLQQPGGCVWYLMKRDNEPNTLYNGCVSRWHNGELQLYNTRAVNAIKGSG